MVACMPAMHHMTLVRHEGAVEPDEASELMRLALRGCELVHEEMSAALRARTIADAERELDDDREDEARGGTRGADDSRKRSRAEAA